MINIKATERNGIVVALKSVNDNDEMMVISAQGIIIRTGLGELRHIGRATQGVRLIRLGEGDQVVAVTAFVPEDVDTDRAKESSPVSAEPAEEAPQSPDEAPPAETAPSPEAKAPEAGPAPADDASGQSGWNEESEAG
jgi:DNA gyrase subunit A